MFTGIIETLGKVKKVTSNEIEISVPLDDIKTGDSISINGVCLTVKDLKKENKELRCSFNISPETISRTNLKFLRRNEFVNIERALKLSARLDGHIVTGHIDSVSRILSIKKVADSYLFKFSIPDGLEKFIAEKGSVSIDGISLTVAEKNQKSFNVAIIPFTFNHTNLRYRKVGDYVNLEVDILARYVNSILKSESNEKSLKNLLGTKQ
ncbi:MAG: riboflavin synthase [Ignavibacteria bacterium]|jgi:riboflavin synthase|nr:riboflavin synthase [Ignavibacteria bacterium]MDH7528759.1 riboflavin synthase [Ignavibacteria bacterium]